MKNPTINYNDIYVVHDYDESLEFKYEHNDQPVEVGTPVAYDRPFVGMPGDKAPVVNGKRTWKMAKADMPVVQLVCFDGIYHQPETESTT